MPCFARFEGYLEAEATVGVHCPCRGLRRGNRHRTAEVTVAVCRAQSLMRFGPVRGDPPSTHNMPRLHLEDVCEVAAERDFELEPHRLHAVVGDIKVFVHAAAYRSADCAA